MELCREGGRWYLRREFLLELICLFEEVRRHFWSLGWRAASGEYCRGSCWIGRNIEICEEKRLYS